MISNPINTIIVSELPMATELLKHVLLQNDYQITFEATSLPQLLSTRTLIEPELIIIILESTELSLLNQIKIINEQYPLPIVIFTNDDSDDAIEYAIESGVSAYIVDGLNEHRILPIIRTARARFNQHQAMQQQLKELRTSLADRKLIDRAKGLLMVQRQCSEEVAYKLLRSTAMNQNIRLANLAQNIISAAELLDSEI